MKKFYFIALIMTLAAGILQAQAPKGFNYQAVVRNSSGQIISNKEVNVRLNILKGTETGPSVYAYSNHVATNQNGVITIVVGENSADYAAINWANGPYFLQSEIDVNNGYDFALVTTQKILSVPYAEYAAVANSISTSFTYDEKDPKFGEWGYLYDSLVNAPTRLSQFINDLNYLTGNDIQLSINGDTLSISGGNYVILPHLGNGSTTIPWDSVIGHPTNLSEFYNDLDFSVSGDTLFMGDKYVTINRATSIPWDSVIGRPTYISQFLNDLNFTISGDTLFYGTGKYVILPQNGLTTVEWTNVNNRPQYLSQFINDLGLSDFVNDLNFTISGDTLFYGNNKYVILPQNVLTSIDWSNITNKPTSLSQFYNDMNFLTSENQGLADVLAVNNNAGNRITGLSTPVNNYDAVNKRYADSTAASLNGLIDSLYSIIDSLSNKLAESQSLNDSLNVTVDSLVHPATPGLLPGKFSIGGNRKVQFSKGNLQYKPKIKIFRFAENQYSIGVNTNVVNGSDCTDWIDLFPYGTSGWAGGRTRFMPYETSTLPQEFALTNDGDGSLTEFNANGDWGIYNPIINGGNQMATWRTLTDVEWNNILNNRPNAANLKTLATVSGQKGMILLPDDWEGTTVGMTMQAAVYTTNVYNSSDWETLEAAGAVFLPSAGYRNGIILNDISSIGYYWSSTAIPGQDQGSTMQIVVGIGSTSGPTDLHRGCSVRLVRDY